MCFFEDPFGFICFCTVCPPRQGYLFLGLGSFCSCFFMWVFCSISYWGSVWCNCSCTWHCIMCLKLSSIFKVFLLFSFSVQLKCFSLLSLPDYWTVHLWHLICCWFLEFYSFVCLFYLFSNSLKILSLILFLLSSLSVSIIIFLNCVEWNGHIHFPSFSLILPCSFI